MFDIGASELLVIVIVAILVIGPKEMPRALRSAGRWIGKFRRVSAHFRAGIDTMIREAELEDAEKEWRERNARIMADTAKQDIPPAMEPLPEGSQESDPASCDSRAEAAIKRAAPQRAPEHGGEEDQTPLPLAPGHPPKGKK